NENNNMKKRTKETNSHWFPKSQEIVVKRKKKQQGYLCKLIQRQKIVEPMKMGLTSNVTCENNQDTLYDTILTSDYE
ncbi:8058_t:CDS:2, partial [Rhizophagus irregularis]